MEKTLNQRAFEYGYQWAGMKVLECDLNKIAERYKKNQLYLLYPDNTEGAVNSFDEIVEHIDDGGFVGEEYQEDEVTDLICPVCGEKLHLTRNFHNQTGKDCLHFECMTEGCDTRMDSLYD